MTSAFPFVAGKAVFNTSLQLHCSLVCCPLSRLWTDLLFSHQHRANTETNLLCHTSRKWTWAMAGLAIFPGALKGCTTFYIDIYTISPISHWGEAGEGVRTAKTRGEKRARSGMGLNRRKKKPPNVRTQKLVRDITLCDLLPLERKHHPSLRMWAPVRGLFISTGSVNIEGKVTCHKGHVRKRPKQQQVYLRKMHRKPTAAQQQKIKMVHKVFLDINLPN